MWNSSIWPIDKILSGATTLGSSGPGSDGNEGVLHILQSSSITAAPPLDCLVLYPGNILMCGDILPLCSNAFCVFYSYPPPSLMVSSTE